MEELDISESRRLRGLGAQPARGAALPPQDRPQRLIAAARRAARARRPVGGRQGHDRPRAARARPRASGCRSRRRPAPPRPGEVDGVDYRFVDPGRVRGAARRRRVPRVVRGLRRPEGHAPRRRSRSTSPPATTCCSRSTCRARWRSASSSPRRCWCSCGRRRREEQRRRLARPGHRVARGARAAAGRGRGRGGAGRPSSTPSS